MPEYKKRPRVAKTSVRTLVNGERETRTAPELNSVLRGVLVDMKRAQGLSTRELSQRIGIRQQSLSALLKDDDSRGCTLRFVSEVCAGLQQTVGELFESHPNYGSGDSSQAWGLICALTTSDQQAMLLETVMLAARTDTLDTIVEQMHSTAQGLAKSHRVDVKATQKQARQVVG